MIRAICEHCGPIQRLVATWWCVVAMASLLGIAPAAMGAAAMSTELVVVGDAQAVSCYSLDTASGALIRLIRSEGALSPSFLAWNAAGTVLYAVHEDYRQGTVSALRIAPDGRALTLLGTVSSGGSGPCHLSVHPSGHWLLVSNYGNGVVAVLPIHADGGLGEAVDVQHPGEHAHMTFCDPSGAWVFVPCLGSDHIAQYRFDARSGRLTPNAVPVITTPAGSGPRFLAGREHAVYCINEHASSVQRYALDATTGVLSVQGPALSLLPAGATAANTGGHVQVAPAGGFLYASNRGHDSIAIFKREPMQGALTYVGEETGGGTIAIPRCFAIDPSGGLLVVANQGAATLSVFTVDSATGALHLRTTTAVGHVPAFVGIMAPTASP